MREKGTLPNAETLKGDEKKDLVYGVFQNISSTYDRANDVISFGAHRLWKRAMIRDIESNQPRDILDVASGTGDIALWIAQENPQARVIGSDLSENMLAVAEKRRQELGLDNVSFSVQNAMELSFDDNSFDAVVVSFGLRNMPDYRQVVSEMIRVLRPGGHFYCIDSSQPTNPIIKPFFWFYFNKIMPALGTLIAHAPEEYKWLSESTRAFLSKDALAAMMRECGLRDVSFRSHMFGGAATHHGVKA